jgi:mannose-6-phosphate isomerase-like protein (cupin superfamily)
MFQTFEPFRQGDRELALVSRDYTTSAVIDLATGEILAEEPSSSAGFCPVGFWVPDWWDVNDGSIIPGSEYWSADREWPTSELGFVWGCIWGDDTSWKLQVLDLRRIREGVLTRDDRFGYVELATGAYVSPCFERELGKTTTPRFLHLSKRNGDARLEIETYAAFDLGTGRSLDARVMREFPEHLRNPRNRIATGSQFPEGPRYVRSSGHSVNEITLVSDSREFTEDIEGYVFDGAEGSQVAFWTSREDRTSTEHAHDFDEYVLVIEGRATLILGETQVDLRAGDEYVIPKGTTQRMAVTRGTRTMHVFGGKRAERQR